MLPPVPAEVAIELPVWADFRLDQDMSVMLDIFGPSESGVSVLASAADGHVPHCYSCLPHVVPSHILVHHLVFVYGAEC